MARPRSRHRPTRFPPEYPCMMTGPMTDLGMNERARALANAASTRAGRVEDRGPDARERRAGRGCRRQGARAASLRASRWLSCAWAASATSSSRRSRSAATSWPGVQRVDRPSGRVLHGVAVRRVGDQPRRVLRDGLGPAAREGARREGAVCKARLRRGRHAGRAGARGPDAPDRTVAAWVAAKAGVAPEALTFAVAPTASLAGGVQIVARVLETGLHKMETLGFDVTRVVSAMGTAPLPTTGEKRHARDRPHQRLHSLRRSGSLRRAGGRRRAGRSSPSACRRPPPPTTARPSTTSSSATTTTSIRSIRCSSARPKSG